MSKRDLYLQQSTDKLSYQFDLSIDEATQLAKLLGCLKTDNTSVPEDMPIFSKAHEEIVIETGFGITFNTNCRLEVEAALEKLDYDVFDSDREWV